MCALPLILISQEHWTSFAISYKKQKLNVRNINVEKIMNINTINFESYY